MAGRISKETGLDIWVSDKCYDWAVQHDDLTVTRNRAVLKLIKKLLNITEPDDPMYGYIRSMLKVKDAWENISEKSIKKYFVGDFLSLGGQKWEVIFTPGHSETQTIFYQKETKQLISADMLLKITPTPVLELIENSNNQRIKSLPTLLSSYKILQNLDFKIAYPGHYEEIYNPYEIIETQILRIHERKEECFVHIKEGLISYPELFAKMYSQVSVPTFSMMLGYIDLLVDENKIMWMENDEKIWFELI